jgi:chromosome segregation ATPase
LEKLRVESDTKMVTLANEKQQLVGELQSARQQKLQLEDGLTVAQKEADHFKSEARQLQADLEAMSNQIVEQEQTIHRLESQVVGLGSQLAEAERKRTS